MTPEKVITLLKALGASPVEVDNILGSIGLGGIPRSPCDCPVARYLTAEGVPNVSVRRYTIRFGYPHAPFEVSVPPAVRGFTLAFDSGRAATEEDIYITL